jgi:hypothetical protein
MCASSRLCPPASARAGVALGDDQSFRDRQSLHRRLSVRIVETRPCAKYPTTDLTSYELHELTSSSYVFPRAMQEWLYLHASGATRFVCLKAWKPVPPLRRYLFWSYSIMTPNRQSTAASATISKREWPRSKISFRGENVRMNCARERERGPKVNPGAPFRGEQSLNLLQNRRIS